MVSGIARHGPSGARPDQTNNQVYLKSSCLGIASSITVLVAVAYRLYHA